MKSWLGSETRKPQLLNGQYSKGMASTLLYFLAPLRPLFFRNSYVFINYSSGVTGHMPIEPQVNMLHLQ